MELKGYYYKPKIECIIYTAGIFDGEGTVCLHVHRSHPAFNTHDLQMSITNTNYELIKYLQDSWKIGSVASHEDQRGNRLQAWHWLVVSNDALFVLDTLFEYLIVKSFDSFVGMSFQKWRLYEMKKYGRQNRPNESYHKESRLKDLLECNRQKSIDFAEEKLGEILGDDLYKMI